MALPQLTDEQRKQALEKAAAARHARAELREQIKKGEIMALENGKIVATGTDLAKMTYRLARSMVLKIKKRDFVEAAVVNGGKPTHILWKHIVPNILPLMVITAAADIGAMMMELAGLSFLGFGSQPPAPEWGLMLNEGRQQLQTAPWLMVFPGLAIFLTVVVFNLWGDSLRDVLDPRQED